MRSPVVLILAVTGLSAGATHQPASYDDYLKEGVRWHQEPRYPEAGAAYANVLDQVEKQLGRERAAAQILVNRRTVRALMHDNPGALAIFQQSRAITEKAATAEYLQAGFTLQTIAMLIPGGLSPDATLQGGTYQALLDQGIRLQKEGHNVEAGTAYAAALGAAERQLGSDHLVCAQILVKIGALRASQNDYSGAKAAYERSVSISEKVLGPDHVEVGFVLVTLALLTQTQGRYAAAEQLYRRAYTILERNLGQEHERTAFLEAAMAKLYLAQRRNTEAEKLLEKAIRVLEKTGPRGESILVVALNNLAGAYRDDGRYAKAEPLYARVLATVEQSPEVLTDEVRAGLTDYAWMLRKMRRRQEARQMQRQLQSLLPR